MKHLLSRLLVPLMFTPALAACDDLLLAPDEPLDDPGEPATTLAPFVSSSTNNYISGLVRFRVGGGARWHTGFLVKPPGSAATTTNIIVTSAARLPLLPVGQCVPTIDVEQGFVHEAVTWSTTTARVINYLTTFNGMTVMVLDRYLEVPSLAALAPSVPAAGTEIKCFGYSPNGGNLRYVIGTAAAATSLGYLYNETVGDMNGELDGWVCMNLQATTVHGFSFRAGPATSEEHVAASGLRDWVTAQAAVASLVWPTRTTRVEALTNVQSGMCADIPGATFADAPINHYPCHQGPNQGFYWRSIYVSRNGVFHLRWMLQNQYTGKCVAHTPTGIRQVACSSADTRQLFERTQQASPVQGKVDVRLRNDATSQCLGTSGATASTPLVAMACSGNASLWRIVDPSYLQACTLPYPWP